MSDLFSIKTFILQSNTLETASISASVAQISEPPLFFQKIGAVEFKPQKINSKNIYGNKSCILQCWFKKNSCSEVEVTDSESVICCNFCIVVLHTFIAALVSGI
jgi:hypothetical protein